MNAIGGYFELELNDYKTLYHDSAVAVNSGRNALEYILRANNQFKKVYLPYYTCDVILQPIKMLKLDFEFYKLDEKFIPKLNSFRKEDVIVYVNYFGIMNGVVKDIIKKYKNVIIDNSQAFFAKPIKNIPTFYSPRKFFGLPDGGFVYSKHKIELLLNRDKSIDRFEHLLERIENGPESGFKHFKENDKKIDYLPLLRMSIITERLLKNINFKNVIKIRTENFKFLHNQLNKINELTPIINREKIFGPMVYPFLRKGNNKLKKLLIRNKIYVATYWPNVFEWTPNKSWEHYLADNMIPLPVDQRYNESNLNKILEVIFG